MIGYFGPEGTFTHQALLQLSAGPAFPAHLSARDVVALPTVAAALDAVRTSEVEASLVPIENSVEGGVSATLDYLARPGSVPLRIVAEVVITVSFELAVRPGTASGDVRRILTHPHAAAQCRGWVAAHFPDAELIEQGSTAAAAATVADPTSGFDAAICAAVARDLYGLESFASDISDNEAAETRFILVSRATTLPASTGADKTTLVAHLRADHSGALLELLQQFAVHGVNLCRIESRPTKTALGSYCFSIDAEGHLADARVAEAVQGLKRVCKEVVYLGSYPRADEQRPKVPFGQLDADYDAAAAWMAGLTS